MSENIFGWHLEGVSKAEGENGASQYVRGVRNFPVSMRRWHVVELACTCRKSYAYPIRKVSRYRRPFSLPKTLHHTARTSVVGAILEVIGIYRDLKLSTA